MKLSSCATIALTIFVILPLTIYSLRLLIENIPQMLDRLEYQPIPWKKTVFAVSMLALIITGVRFTTVTKCHEKLAFLETEQPQLVADCGCGR